MLRAPCPRRAGQRLVGWFEILRLTSDRSAETTVASPLTDQAVLHGLLAKIRDLGLPLLSARQIDPD
jgi:hypothetical protein